MKQVGVAIGIIHQAGWVLICQRRTGDRFTGLWEFPGGKIEPGESPRAAAVREVAEELGIVVKPTAAFAVIQHPYGDFSVRLHPFLCRIVGGHPRPLACQRMKWVRAEHLADYPFPPANAELVQQIASRLSNCDIPAMTETHSIDFAPLDS